MVFFRRLGEIRDRSYENQRYRASGLNLLFAVITLWNTVYLERAVNALRYANKRVAKGVHLQSLRQTRHHVHGFPVFRARRRSTSLVLTGPNQPRDYREERAHYQHCRDRKKEFEPRTVDDDVAWEAKQMHSL